MLNIYEQVDRNKTRSLMIMVIFVVFIGLIVWVFSYLLGYGEGFVSLAVIISLLMSFAGYWWGDKLVLTVSGAKPANKQNYFNFYTVAENLAMAAQIPKPKLYIIEDSALNAFATGRDPEHGIICATTGLLEKLNRTELEGVIAHELAHIKNYDTRLMVIVAVLVGTVALMADWFFHGIRVGQKDNNRNGNLGAFIFILGMVMALLSPLIAKLIQLAISRQREFLADASGVQIVKYPEGLASALSKIANDTQVLEVANHATAHLFIVNPFKSNNTLSSLNKFFSTHPPVLERIKMLNSMR